jgi:opacity protein-like surface antigen
MIVAFYRAPMCEEIPAIARFPPSKSFRYRNLLTLPFYFYMLLGAPKLLAKGTPMKLRTIAIVLTVVLASAAAYAQSGAYLTFNSQMWTQEGVNTYVTHPGSQNIDRPWLLGAGYGVYYDVTHLPYLGKVKTGPVLLGIDARGETFRDGTTYGTFNQENGIFSIRVATAKPVKGYTPYILGGFGIAHTKVPYRLYYSNNFTYQFGAGVDTQLHKKIDWRIVEFRVGAVANYPTGYSPSGAGAPNESNYMITLGTGLVFRIR